MITCNVLDNEAGRRRICCSWTDTSFICSPRCQPGKLIFDYFRSIKVIIFTTMLMLLFWTQTTNVHNSWLVDWWMKSWPPHHCYPQLFNLFLLCFITRYQIELATKVREDFTNREKALVGVESTKHSYKIGMQSQISQPMDNFKNLCLN